MFTISFSNCQTNTPIAPGYRFSNFRGTPIENIAIAIEKDDTILLNSIIKEKSINLNYLEPKYNQPIINLAIWYDKKKEIKWLLKNGANPNIICGNNSITPFLLTCSLAFLNRDNISMMTLLIKYGADVNAVQIYRSGGGKIIKKTPLDYICESGNVSELKLLINNGADLNSYPKNGEQSLISRAEINPKLDIMRYLLMEKKVPIPDYCVIRYPGTQNEKKITLRQLINERQVLKDAKQEKIEQEILFFLSQNGK